MPVYEFVCKQCAEAFEELVFGAEKVACPACKSPRVEKRFSTFASHGAESSAPPPAAGGCGTCGDPRGPGACRMG